MEEQSGGDAGDAGRAGHEPVRTCEVLAVELWLKKSQKILDATIKTGFMHRKAIEFSIIPLLS